ncbi:MAG TPA: GNAT family N-acetyltransferase [Clostridia bacterium]|nr:GNAT family N-acetyltransferase [Clostridia bacterium]
MELRYATLNDLQGVYKLICELEMTGMPIIEFESIYSQNINRNDVHYLVVEEKGELIAFASMHIQSLLHHSADVAEIQELIIQNDFRGKGTGSKLIDKLVEISKEKKCELIEVSCNRKRIDSHEFYEHNGFSKSHYKFTLR